MPETIEAGSIVYYDFTGKCGPKSSATSDVGLQPGGQVRLNGKEDLQDCIVGDNGAYIEWIRLDTGAGVYDYVITVYGRGPSGAFKHMDLTFTDETGDSYSLSLYSTTVETHTVRYNSHKPAIKLITWD